MVCNINGYSTMTFSEIYPDINTFINGRDLDEDGTTEIIGYNTISNFKSLASEESLVTIYYLLMSRYMNSPISNSDINQFSLKLFSLNSIPESFINFLYLSYFISSFFTYFTNYGKYFLRLCVYYCRGVFGRDCDFDIHG